MLVCLLQIDDVWNVVGDDHDDGMMVRERPQ
jgi:hypothetical protein